MDTSSDVTALMTSGPVTNMWLVPSTMTVKSVMAGEYTAPPAQGPSIAEICGTTPEASVFLRNTSAYAPSETTPSWMRAPPESFKPTTGAPLSSARSMMAQIFFAFASLMVPPNTVKSCANAYTSRPSTCPQPATTPSPVMRLSAMPKSVERWVTNVPISTNEPAS